MAHIHIGRPFYIDRAAIEKIWNIFKKDSLGGLAHILGPIYAKVPKREFFFLNNSSKSSLDTQKLIPVEIPTYFFSFQRVIDPDRLALRKQFYMWG